jgi:DNA-binding transcriptional regulator YiaG
MDKDDIRRIRHKLGWSQERLAQHLNVSWVSVNRWEAGKNEPKPETIDKLLELSKMGEK